MKVNSERSYGLDFLKVTATILIVFHHYQLLYKVSFDKGINFANGNFYFGYLVELFFVLSGYVIFKYADHIECGEISFSSWFGRRYRRVVPLLFVSAIVSEAAFTILLGLTGEYFGAVRSISVWGIIAAGLGLQGSLFPITGVNNPTWYISVLLLCYVLFYTLSRYSGRSGIKNTYIYLIPIAIGLVASSYGTNGALLYWGDRRGYYSFFVGVLLAQYIDCFGITKKELLLSLAALLSCLAVIVIKPLFIMEHMSYIMAFVLAPALVFIVESAAVKKLFKSPLWQNWGAVSFNVYIWHYPMFMVLDIALLVLGVEVPKNSVVTMLAYLIAIELFAAFSHRCIEKPLDKLWAWASKDLQCRYEARKEA